MGVDQAKYPDELSALHQESRSLHSLMEPFKGTGQGLAIVHAVVVEKHGGRVTVESEVGRGTCFHLFLPLGIQDDGKVGGVRAIPGSQGADPGIPSTLPQDRP
jgi:light-regulated signal transduction histidine kinase (bacteriophytochrome)